VAMTRLAGNLQMYETYLIRYSKDFGFSPLRVLIRIQTYFFSKIKLLLLSVRITIYAFVNSLKLLEKVGLFDQLVETSTERCYYSLVCLIDRKRFLKR
jgi:hypothetical protein